MNRIYSRYRLIEKEKKISKFSDHGNRYAINSLISDNAVNRTKNAIKPSVFAYLFSSIKFETYSFRGYDRLVNISRNLALLVSSHGNGRFKKAAFGILGFEKGFQREEYLVVFS